MQVSARTPLPTFPQQSPIHLEDPIHADFGDRGLQVDWADLGPITMKAEQDGHGAHLDVTGGSRPEIHLDRKRFELQGFHFHTPSEHVVEGKRYPMEIHLVHKNQETGELAVVGAFVAGDERPELQSLPMAKFLTQVKDALSTGAEVQVDPHVLLPREPEKYYRYEGSLTTPPYDSNVSWSVFKEPIHVSPVELAALKDVFEKPARDPQPLHRRFVLARF